MVCVLCKQEVEPQKDPDGSIVDNFWQHKDLSLKAKPCQGLGANLHSGLPSGNDDVEEWIELDDLAPDGDFTKNVEFIGDAMSIWDSPDGAERGARLKLPSLEVIVHRHIDYPKDTWLCSCYAIKLERAPLESKDLEFAKTEALNLVFSRIEKMRNELYQAYQESL
jgi:hypothetical protein